MRAKKNNCRLFAYASLLFFVSIYTPNSFSACNATAATTPTSINFGTPPSQNIPAGGITSNGTGVSARFSVSCSTALSLQLLSITSWLSYSAQQPLKLGNGTSEINYTISSESTYANAITQPGQSIGGQTGFNLLTLSTLTGGAFTIPLYIRTLSTSVWPRAGTYTGTQTLAVTGSICTGIGLLGVCPGSSPVNSVVTFTLNMVVSKSCEFINTPAQITFSAVSFLDTTEIIRLNTTLRCTQQEDYSLYVDNGSNYSGNSRHLRSTTGNRIAYNVLQPGSKTAPLSAITPLSRIGTGVNETLSIPLKISPNQPSPPAGIYTDSIRVVIEF
jgi:spore coat protein U-like protein